MSKTAAKVVINPGVEIKVGGSKPKKLPIIRSYYQPFFFAAVPANILTVVLCSVIYSSLPPVVPLFGTMMDPAARLADKQWLFLLPAIATVINVIHAAVIYLGRKYEVTLLRVFGFFTVFVQVLILAVLLRAVLVVLPLGMTT